MDTLTIAFVAGVASGVAITCAATKLAQLLWNHRSRGAVQFEMAEYENKRFESEFDTQSTSPIISPTVYSNP